MATSNPEATEQVILTIEDDTPQPVEVQLSGWMPSGERRVRIALADDDTSGQSLSGSALVSVIVSGDDVEGQSMTLRFPTPSDAAEFQRKLLLTGALAGTLAAASVGASIALQSQTGSAAITGAQAGPVAAIHDTDKLVSVPFRDTDKLSTIAIPARDTDKLSVGAGANAAAANTATSVERSQAASSTGGVTVGEPSSEFGLDAQASRQAAMAGAEAQAKADQAAAGATSLGASASDEGGSTDGQPMTPNSGPFHGR